MKFLTLLNFSPTMLTSQPYHGTKQPKMAYFWSKSQTPLSNQIMQFTRKTTFFYNINYFESVWSRYLGLNEFKQFQITSKLNLIIHDLFDVFLFMNGMIENLIPWIKEVNWTCICFSNKYTEKTKICKNRILN